MPETEPQPAPQEQAPEPPQSVADTVTGQLIGRAVRAAAKGARHRTRSNLEVCSYLVQGEAHEVIMGAHSSEDIATFRDQTIGLFSAPLSMATGESLTQKRLKNEWLPIHYMVETLPDETRERARACNWESLRTLARWSVWVVNNPEFSPHACYTETWKIREGCETKLCELIATLAKAPIARDKLIAEMDKHERGDKPAPQPVPRDVVKAKNTFCDGIADRAAGDKSVVKMTPEEFAGKLVERALIPKYESRLDGLNFATMTVEQATTLADEIIKHAPIEAVAKLAFKLAAAVKAAQGPHKPAGAPGASLDALKRTVHAATKDAA